MTQLCIGINSHTFENVVNCTEPQEREKKYVWYNQYFALLDGTIVENVQSVQQVETMTSTSIPIAFSIKKSKNDVFVFYNNVEPQIPWKLVNDLRQELQLEPLNFVSKKVECSVEILVSLLKHYETEKSVEEMEAFMNENGLVN